MNDLGRIFHDEVHFIASLAIALLVIREAKNHIDPDSTTGKALNWLFH